MHSFHFANIHVEKAFDEIKSNKNPWANILNIISSYLTDKDLHDGCLEENIILLELISDQFKHLTLAELSQQRKEQSENYAQEIADLLQHIECTELLYKSELKKLPNPLEPTDSLKKCSDSIHNAKVKLEEVKNKNQLFTAPEKLSSNASFHSILNIHHPINVLAKFRDQTFKSWEDEQVDMDEYKKFCEHVYDEDSGYFTQAIKDMFRHDPQKSLDLFINTHIFNSRQFTKFVNDETTHVTEDLDYPKLLEKYKSKTQQHYVDHLPHRIDLYIKACERGLNVCDALIKVFEAKRNAMKDKNSEVFRKLDRMISDVKCEKVIVKDELKKLKPLQKNLQHDSKEYLKVVAR